ncbi:MAG: hypothetical protein H7Z37_08815 [Pyrinomonadaceae bacterium]|nr:hypothetical protein [Pyrinomonadaceae bacterium]
MTSRIRKRNHFGFKTLDFGLRNDDVTFEVVFDNQRSKRVKGSTAKIKTVIYFY